MKKLMLLCTVILGSLFTLSCEGPRGPQGPQGNQGNDGGNEYPYVMDIRLSFDQNLNDNMATNVVKHPFELHLGDVVLIYIKDGNTNNGSPIWTPLPIRYLVEDTATQKNEELEYLFNFAEKDFEIIARATVPLDFFANVTNPSGSINYVRNQEFRVVYIPALDPVKRTTAQTTNKEIQFLSYDEAVVKYNLQNVEVHKTY